MIKELTEQEKSRLKPAQRVRSTKPRVCAFCKYAFWNDWGGVHCQRPNGPAFEAGDGIMYLTTCNMYQPDETRI